MCVELAQKMAPSYAILFMADLEERLLESSELKPFVWWRCIDDIFVIWEHGEENLHKFISHINSIPPSNLHDFSNF